jgi:hypothetical protein
MTEPLKISLNNVTDEWKKKITSFFIEINKPYEDVENPEDANIVIDSPDEKKECEPNLLHIAGRISCPISFVAAHRMGIERADFGRLANLLNIKIFGCQLGCFK